MNLKGICLLDKDINTCPHHDGAGHCFSPNESCGMLEKVTNTTHEKPREPKWYEKYYR